MFKDKSLEILPLTLIPEVPEDLKWIRIEKYVKERLLDDSIKLKLANSTSNIQRMRSKIWQLYLES